MSGSEVKTTWNDPMPGIKAATRSGLREVLVKTVAEAKSIASGFKDPTGRTLNSIMYRLEGEEGGFNDGGGGQSADSSDKLNESKEELVGYVGTNVHYAIYQETGTRLIPPHPFIRPAIAICAQGQPVADVMAKWAKIHAKGKLGEGEIREGF